MQQDVIPTSRFDCETYLIIMTGTQLNLIKNAQEPDLSIN